jgi:hypothetical protein
VFSTFCSIFSCNPSFISAAHSSATSCASIAQPPLGRPIPVPWGRSKKGKKKKKEGKQSKKGKKEEKKDRPPHSPSGTREPIRLGEGVLRHSFSWLASLLGCTVHTLVAISP